MDHMETRAKYFLPFAAITVVFMLAACFALPTIAHADSTDSLLDKVTTIASESTVQELEAIEPAPAESNVSDKAEATGEAVGEIAQSSGEEELAFDPNNPPEFTDQIMGQRTIPAEAMVTHFNDSGKAYPSDTYAAAGAPTIEDFVNLCIEEAEAEGVRPEVLFAQILHETGYLQFGGQVQPEQNNFGGLGATNDGANGASFSDVREGLRAQVQHLKAYASTEDLVNPVVDPRFDLVTRGCAPTVYDLGGKWAYPGDTYGEAIMRHIEQMYAIAYS